MEDAEQFNNTVALLEGWAVFHAIGTADDGDVRIERLDEEPVFETDQDVWTHVIQRGVIEGSAYHRDALLVVKGGNKTEWDRIAAHAAVLGIDINANI
jgi:hypothetical protein